MSIHSQKLVTMENKSITHEKPLTCSVGGSLRLDPATRTTNEPRERGRHLDPAPIPRCGCCRRFRLDFGTMQTLEGRAAPAGEHPIFKKCAAHTRRAAPGYRSGLCRCQACPGGFLKKTRRTHKHSCSRVTIHGAAAALCRGVIPPGVSARS